MLVACRFVLSDNNFLLGCFIVLWFDTNFLFCWLISCFVWCLFVFLVLAQFAVTDDCNLLACTPELFSVPDITI